MNRMPAGAASGQESGGHRVWEPGTRHSLNLRDSGIEVGVAELPGTPNYKLATEHGFKPGDIKTAMEGPP